MACDKQILLERRLHRAIFAILDGEQIDELGEE